MASPPTFAGVGGGGAQAGEGEPLQLKPGPGGGPAADELACEREVVASGNTEPEESPYLPHLDAKRVEALRALQTLDDAVDDLVTEVKQWQGGAWDVVFQATGADPFIGLTSDEWHALFMGPFESSLGMAVAASGVATADMSTMAPPSPGSGAGAAATAMADAVGNTALEIGLGAAGKYAIGGGGGRASALLLAAFGEPGCRGCSSGRSSTWCGPSSATSSSGTTR